MTKAQFMDAEQTLNHNGVTIRVSEHVCLGFYHGARVQFERPIQGTNHTLIDHAAGDDMGYVSTMPAMFGRDYKRFPAKRFAAWLYETYFRSDRLGKSRIEYHD